MAARLVSIDGAQLDREKLKGFARRFLYTRPVASVDGKPPYVDIAERCVVEASDDDAAAYAPRKRRRAR